MSNTNVVSTISVSSQTSNRNTEHYYSTAFNASSCSITSYSQDPPARARAGMVVYNGELIVFGGNTMNGATLVYYNDTWAYNISTKKWRPITTTNTPIARAAMGMVLTNSNGIFMHGGLANISGTETYMNDAYYLNPATWTWSAAPNLNGPTGRSDFAYAYYSAQNYYICHGGETAHLTNTGQTWTYDFSTETWEERFPIGTAPTISGHSAATIVGDLLYLAIGFRHGFGEVDQWWGMHLLDNVWFQMNTSGRPSSRCGCVFQSFGTNIYVVGGFSTINNVARNDAWVYHVTDTNTGAGTWENLSTYSAVVPTTGSAGSGNLKTAWAVNGNSLFIYGGFQASFWQATSDQLWTGNFSNYQSISMTKDSPGTIIVGASSFTKSGFTMTGLIISGKAGLRVKTEINCPISTGVNFTAITLLYS